MNRIGQEPWSKTGQFMDSSMGMPMVSSLLVLNEIPPLEMFKLSLVASAFLPIGIGD